MAKRTFDVVVKPTTVNEVVGGLMDMTDKHMPALAIGYLEGLSVWLWGRTDNEISCESVDAYDRALETLRKAIDWNEVGE